MNRLWKLGRTVSVVVAVIAVAAVGASRAQGDGPPPIPGEAFAACDGKSVGDACTVQFRDMKIEGTCAGPPSGERLICRPNNMPPPPRRSRDQTGIQQPKHVRALRIV